MTLWWSRDTLREWYALNEARTRRCYGISRKDRWAIIGGRLIRPVANRRPPYWVWNGAGKQLYMSAYHLAPDMMPAYLDALTRYRVTYLFGYSSGLHALAETALRLKRTDVRLRVAITNAEPLLQHQREAIAAAFSCPVRETYGLAEIVAGGCECECGSLHLWPDVGMVEAIDGAKAVRDGRLGRPGKHWNTERGHAADPLSYRRRRFDYPQGLCKCGSAMPIVEALEGRSRRPGRHVGWPQRRPAGPCLQGRPGDRRGADHPGNFHPLPVCDMSRLLAAPARSETSCVAAARPRRSMWK